jgi:hypothetical protein
VRAVAHDRVILHFIECVDAGVHLTDTLPVLFLPLEDVYPNAESV